ncbi:uncharacterized protein LOC133541198 [Nerophis ophidion]|uniref:uncharacterized protein LOC133541198 n=1 Tax=Nerophis ophidion TaxID=159077 RepID=UPI002ADF129D|nr:uncharacterized protein LOC133541198 [Nerophis ophidion]
MFGVQVSHFLCEAMAPSVLSMDVPLMLALATVALLCGVLLACVDCWRNAPPVSIREDTATAEYILSTNFPHALPHFLMISPTSDLLSPMAPPPDPGSGSERGCVTPTQSESNASYENSHAGLDYPECFAEDYVLVLPDASTNQSAASTPSSGVRHEYVNVPAAEWREPSGSSPVRAMERLSLSDDREYLDVTPHSAASTGSASGESSTLSSQSEEDEAQYVNQPV